MKRTIITLACFSLSIAAANAQAQKAPQDQATETDAGCFRFKEETHNYGSVPEGPGAECDFTFKNTGRKPILIKEAHGSCGCTVPKWPKEPVMPGKKGTIHVTYNTAGRVGPIQKDVIITSDAQQNPMVLHITGTVAPKAAEQSVGKIRS